MSNPPQGPYHRLGSPGGPGCEVSALPVVGKSPSGEMTEATLLSTHTSATEVELLRTIVHSFGIRWGHDDYGWWAVIPGQAQAGGEDGA